MHLRMAEKNTKSHLICSEWFQSNPTECSEIWNLYVKNIIFAFSLPMSSSTWHCDHLNGPGRYLSVGLKLENINKNKPSLDQAIIQQRLLNYPIEYNYISE
jgi:hypothetical protein